MMLIWSRSCRHVHIRENTFNYIKTTDWVKIQLAEYSDFYLFFNTIYDYSVSIFKAFPQFKRKLKMPLTHLA